MRLFLLRAARADQVRTAWVDNLGAQAPAGSREQMTKRCVPSGPGASRARKLRAGRSRAQPSGSRFQLAVFELIQYMTDRYRSPVASRTAVEDMSFREELTSMPPFKAVPDDEERLKTYILQRVPASLKKELDEYIEHRTATFAARRPARRMNIPAPEKKFDAPLSPSFLCLVLWFGSGFALWFWVVL